MKKIYLLIVLCSCIYSLQAQEKHEHFIKGMYIQWGYNADAYTHSSIHFKMSNGDNFVLHHARAHDRGDYNDIFEEPGQITIPQYNYRFGFYLNDAHTRSF